MSLLLSSSSSGITISPGKGSLVITGFAAILGIAVMADTGAMTIASQAPTLNFTINTAPGTGVLVLTGLPPVLNSGVPVGQGQLTLNGFSPELNSRVLTGLGSVQLSSFSPSVGYGILSGQGSILINGFSPTIAVSTLIFPPLGAVFVSGFSPTADATINQQVLPDTGLAQLVGYTPVVDNGAPAPSPPPAVPSDNWSMGSDSRRAIPIQGSYGKFAGKEREVREKIKREDEEIVAIIKCFIECLS